MVDVLYGMCYKVLCFIMLLQFAIMLHKPEAALHRCSENMQQMSRRTPMPKCDFNKVAKQIALRHGCSPVNLLHIFRAHFNNGG